jgi:hypothetical protein
VARQTLTIDWLRLVQLRPVTYSIVAVKEGDERQIITDTHELNMTQTTFDVNLVIKCAGVGTRLDEVCLAASDRLCQRKLSLISGLQP